MNFNNKNVLVTGGAGFIGQHLVNRLLEEGAEVTVVDEHEPHWIDTRIIRMDLLNPEPQLKMLVDEANIIFHFAAYSSAVMFQDFVTPYEANVKGLLTILDLASSSSNGPKRVIFPSSSTVYSTHSFPWTEDMPIYTPVNWYAASKLSGEMLCKHYTKYKKLETVCLRIFCGYGPGEEHKGNYSSPLSQFVQSMVAGQSPEIWKDGRQERDFVYIADIIEALLLASLEPVSGEVFNVGTGLSATFLEVVRVINNLLGTEISPKFTNPNLTSYLDKTLADTRKAERMLGFKAKKSLREGISKLIPQ